MGCLLFKESKLNFLENLKTEGYINDRRELTFEKDIHKYLNNLVDRLNLNYDLDLKALVTIKEVKIKTGKDFSRDSEKFILTPIEESFEQIDNRRKELGIYEDRISIGEYNKTQSEQINKQEEKDDLKPFIDESNKIGEQIRDVENRKIGTNEERYGKFNELSQEELFNKKLREEVKDSGGDILWTSSEGYRYGINSLRELRLFTEKDAKSSNYQKENNRMGSISFRFPSDSSNFEKYLQSSFGEIWKEVSQINNLEANIVTSAFIAQQISEQSDKFYGRLLSRIRDSFGVQANGNISLQDNTAYLYVDDKNSISINLYRIGQYASKFSSFDAFEKDLENTLNEESIHLAITNLATDEEMRQVFDEMTNAQKKDVKEIYKDDKNLKSEDNKINLAHEFIRMIIQNKYTGEITESSNPTLTKIIKRFLDRVKEWLGEPAIKTNEILDRFDKLVNNKEIKEGVDFVFEQSPELFNIGTREQYSQYLDTIFPDSKVEEIDDNLYISVLNQLEQNEIIEKDCFGGKLKAQDGISTSFTKGGKWKLIKDLKGYPTHKKGGVDLIIGKDGVKIKNGNTEFTAKHGLVIPKN